MNRDITDIVKKFASLPNARVDRNYKQGRNFVAEQMLGFSMIDDLSSPDVDKFIAHSKRKFAKLKKMVAPNQLPEEYAFFLKNYGGLCLVDEYEVPEFTLTGIGPGMEDWYGDITEANQQKSEIEQLRIGSWNMPIPFIQSGGKPLSPRLQRFNFYIDLAGDLEKDSIVTAGPWDYKKPEKEWKFLAASFSEWLARIVELGSAYIND